MIGSDHGEDINADAARLAERIKMNFEELGI